MDLYAETLLVISTFLLGLRHGVDWDHIAAISDIVSAQERPGKALWLGTVYALGHATVVGVLGILAVLLDVRLPEWVDGFMEPFVGMTLVVLGAYVIYSLIAHRGHVHLRSRWMLLREGVAAAYAHVRGKGTSSRVAQAYGEASAYAVGMIHGIGAETPTQVLLFIAAAGAAGRTQGVLLVLTFIVGLIIANTAIVVASTYGLGRARQHATAWAIFGGVTGAFSIAVGMMFLLGRGHLLPPILGQ